MKSILRVFATAIIAGIVLMGITSCNNGGEPGGGIVIDPDAEILFGGAASYWGDYYEVGASNFDMHMYTADADGNGYFVSVDFFSEDPASESDPDIASGTYAVNGTRQKYTAIPGKHDEENDVWDHSVVGVITDEITDFMVVTGGTFEVDNQGGGNYVVAYKLQLSDGSIFKGYYSGPLEVSNRIPAEF